MIYVNSLLEIRNDRLFVDYRYYIMHANAWAEHCNEAFCNNGKHSFHSTSDRLTDALNQQCLIKVQGRELRRRVPVKAQKLEPQRAPKVGHPKVPKATLLSPQTLKLWPRRSQKKRPWLLVLVSNSPTPISHVLLFW